MAGLDPAIHALLRSPPTKRGNPEQQSEPNQKSYSAISWIPSRLRRHRGVYSDAVRFIASMKWLTTPGSDFVSQYSLGFSEILRLVEVIIDAFSTASLSEQAKIGCSEPDVVSLNIYMAINLKLLCNDKADQMIFQTLQKEADSQDKILILLYRSALS